MKEKKDKEVVVYNLLKKGVWLYFLLLIFEGALRKWFLPFLAGPLLVVRDPLAIWLIYIAWNHNIMKFNPYVMIMTFVGVFGIGTALVFGHGNLFVAIYGARILILHFPVMFIIGEVFDKNDVIKLGKVLLWMVTPMAILIALQFYSPQSAWVNRGIGGDIEGAGFSGANGFFRPPGTFSFTIGNVLFFSFAACYVIYFWLVKEKINRLLLICATIALIAAIPLSISRTLTFTIGVVFVFSLFSVANKPKFFKPMLVFMILITIFIAILSQTTFFDTATGVVGQRFENAGKAEGTVAESIIHRFFGGMFSAVEEENQLPFFGFGLGIGTNVGSAILTGERTFLIAEAEWGRLVGELGFLLGMVVIFTRLFFCISLLMKSFNNIKLDNILPWLLSSYGLLYILQGQWAQPTILGFSTLIGGLILSSLQKDNIKNIN